jgi:hypothetical protein
MSHVLKQEGRKKAFIDVNLVIMTPKQVNVTKV